MKKLAADNLRILAISPVTRGFGFAVLEGKENLLDWGIKAVGNAKNDKNEDCLRQIAAITYRYRPSLIVVENCQAKGSRRLPRIQELIRRTLTLVSERKIKARKISRIRVRKVFAQGGVTTKYEIARAIAQRFPELAPRLPRFRKPWMSEDQRMSIFDAIALVLTLFGEQDE